ncbi:ATP-grasp domain-containing protein, partial [Candidatus Acetothermia bacterium]|nr:ATP-grasp domain-containing protein [Candidatus Acetothermia bacterium]
DKRAARETAQQLGVPTVPGVNECDTSEQIRAAVHQVGLPILLKASAGGGGKGMRLIHQESELDEAIQASQREAFSAFGDSRLMVEKFVSPARHIEVQLLSDAHGNVIALGERECSLQRRYQKIIEESPSAAVSSELREKIQEAACKLARATGYRNAGTAEFLLGPDGNFYFLEVNTRLQVEHPVTECVTGLDLVRKQIEIAAGEKLSLQQKDILLRGYAIEARLYAEDPSNRFLPTTGKILKLRWPTLPGVRIDSGIREGQEILTHYDPLLAKVIAWGPDREQARQRLIQALRETVLLGLVTNQSFLVQLLEDDSFKNGKTFIHTVESTMWDDPEEEWKEPMLLTAALALSSRTQRDRNARAEDRVMSKDPHSPWESLGRWRMLG